MPARGNAASGGIFARARNAIRNTVQNIRARVTGRGSGSASTGKSGKS